MPDQVQFSDAQKASYRESYAPTATDAQWNLFINECQRRNLVPGVHVVFQLRDYKEYNEQLRTSVDAKRVVFITTIAALRLIAQRNGNYAGHGPFTYYYLDGADNFKQSAIPFGRTPHAVSVDGYRKDWQVPLFATARYTAYVQTKDGEPTYMWKSSGEEMTAKCCEALMLRTVAPEECAGLLISEELGNTGLDKETAQVTAVTPAVVPKATVAPVVNQSADVKIEQATETIKASPEALAALNVKVEQVQTTPFANVPTPDPALTALLKKTLAEATPGETVTVGPAVVVPPPTPATVVVQEVAPPSLTGTATSYPETPATAKEFSDFISGRATKIVRDKLPKAGMKESEASNGIKNYLLKQSGKTGLKQISAATFERLLKALEDATPEQAAEIVRAQSK